MVKTIVETMQAIKNLLRHVTTRPENLNTSKATETLDKPWAMDENIRANISIRKMFPIWTGDREPTCLNWPASAKGVIAMVVERNKSCRVRYQYQGAIKTSNVD